AGAILNHEGLLGFFGEMLSEYPRVNVSGTACTKWDDEFNGAGREVLCCNRQSQQNWQYEGCQTQKRAHKSSTLVCSGCYNVVFFHCCGYVPPADLKL